MGTDRDDFWILLEPEYTKAMMFCRKLVGDRDQGDDLFQDALVQAYTGFRSLRHKEAFRSWLYRIMINRFKSSARRPLWKRIVPMTPDVELNLAGPDPSDDYDARRWLREAFKTISHHHQVLITMHELEGWPVNELAEMFETTEGAIKANLFRARNKLKDALKKKFLVSSRKSKQAVVGKETKCVAARSEAK